MNNFAKKVTDIGISSGFWLLVSRSLRLNVIRFHTYICDEFDLNPDTCTIIIVSSAADHCADL